MKITQKKGAARTPWTEEEVKAAIELYATFLTAQRNGEKYSKAPQVRALAERIGRSKGSVEAKLMNISGVRAAAGLDFVQGYKPLKNAQALMVKLVKEAAGITAAVILAFPELLRLAA